MSIIIIFRLLYYLLMASRWPLLLIIILIYGNHCYGLVPIANGSFIHSCLLLFSRKIEKERIFFPLNYILVMSISQCQHFFSILLLVIKVLHETNNKTCHELSWACFFCFWLQAFENIELKPHKNIFSSPYILFCVIWTRTLILFLK